MRKPYWELLKDPRWQKRRLEIFNASNFTCQHCLATDKTLHVHHKIYRKGWMPWDYSDSELMCLCDECHELETARQGLLNESIAKLCLRDRIKLIAFADGLVVASEVSSGEDAKSYELVDNESYTAAFLAAIIPLPEGVVNRANINGWLSGSQIKNLLKGITGFLNRKDEAA